MNNGEVQGHVGTRRRDPNPEEGASSLRSTGRTPVVRQRERPEEEADVEGPGRGGLNERQEVSSHLPSPESPSHPKGGRPHSDLTNSVFQKVLSVHFTDLLTVNGGWQDRAKERGGRAAAPGWGQVPLAQAREATMEMERQRGWIPEIFQGKSQQESTLH